jgi:hypothetical protein
MEIGQFFKMKSRQNMENNMGKSLLGSQTIMLWLKKSLEKLVFTTTTTIEQNKKLAITLPEGICESLISIFSLLVNWPASVARVLLKTSINVAKNINVLPQIMPFVKSHLTGLVKNDPIPSPRPITTKNTIFQTRS